MLKDHHLTKTRFDIVQFCDSLDAAQAWMEREDEVPTLTEPDPSRRDESYVWVTPKNKARRRVVMIIREGRKRFQKSLSQSSSIIPTQAMVAVLPQVLPAFH